MQNWNPLSLLYVLFCLIFAGLASVSAYAIKSWVESVNKAMAEQTRDFREAVISFRDSITDFKEQIRSEYVPRELYDRDMAELLRSRSGLHDHASSH